MKRIFILVFVLFGKVCFGQDHLAPSDLDNVYRVYYKGMKELLYNGFSTTPVARFTALPSFKNESAFSLEEKYGRYYIVSNKLTKNYWYAENKKDVKVIHDSTQISRVLYEKMGMLFNTVISQMSQMEKNGLDGETSYFSVMKNGELTTGEIWSPGKWTKMGRLVEVCKKCYNVKSEPDILKEIEELLKDL